ncbi:MAG: DUF4340 domain-containing protein [Chloroflexi bacterium]|nr:DUF4340 domain-containing protein [Chloroflexota bacterium]
MPYTVMLLLFAGLMVGLLIDNGPPFQPKANNATPAAIEAPIFGPEQSLDDIIGIRLVSHVADASILLVRGQDNSWVRGDVANAVPDPTAAEFATEVIYNLWLTQLVKFDATSDLSQYGLDPQPQFVVSFGVIAYNQSNGNEVKDTTLHIGSLNPDQTAYYAVFADGVTNARLGEWVYLIDKESINTLMDLLATNFAPLDATPPADESQTPPTS